MTFGLESTSLFLSLIYYLDYSSVWISTVPVPILFNPFFLLFPVSTGFSSFLSTSALAELNLSQDEKFSLLSEAIQPIPLKIELDSRKVRLGKSLFQDKKFSGNNQVSCSSCHYLSLGGADQIPKSVGTEKGFINAPTVLNSGFNIKQFWDGRADSLEEQIDGPLTSSNEMNSSWSKVLKTLKASSSYKSEFKAIYAEGITEENTKGHLEK